MAEPKKYPYTTVPNNLRKLLQKLPALGSPPAASQKWLESIGFSGGNNKSLLPVLRQVGVIDSSGKPTDYWTALRSGDKARFADAVRTAYSDLFATYVDADKQTPETLQTFFRTHTGLGEKAQSFCVRTFKVLVEFGDFNQPTEKKHEVEEAAEERAAELDLDLGQLAGGGANGGTSGGSNGGRPAQAPLALTVNLQIELPPSADGEVYDKLFAAMGKHLRGLVAPAE
jgi:hypothetical protein